MIEKINCLENLEVPSYEMLHHSFLIDQRLLACPS